MGSACLVAGLDDEGYSADIDQNCNKTPSAVDSGPRHSPVPSS